MFKLDCNLPQKEKEEEPNEWPTKKNKQTLVKREVTALQHGLVKDVFIPTLPVLDASAQFTQFGGVSLPYLTSSGQVTGFWS